MSIFEKGLAWTLYRHMEAEFVNYLDYVPYTADNEGVYSPRLIGMLLQICGYVDSIFKAMAEYEAFKKDVFCQEIVQREKEHMEAEEDPTPQVTRESDATKPHRIDGSAMTLYHGAFEKLYNLASNNRSEIIAKVGWEQPRNRERKYPFQSFGPPDKRKWDPDWWVKYQGVKHTCHISVKDASLKNVLNALAGAFLLNVVHLPSLESLYDMGLLMTYMELGGGIYKKPVDHIEKLRRDDFDMFVDKAKDCALKLELVRFAWPLWIETPLFIYRHPRDAVIEKEEASKS